MSLTEKEEIANPNAGGMSTKALVIVFVAYAFTRSVKPSSSYLAHYFKFVDSASQEIPNYQNLDPVVSDFFIFSNLLFYVFWLSIVVVLSFWLKG